jgi:hypothetical protein
VQSDTKKPPKPHLPRATALFAEPSAHVGLPYAALYEHMMEAGWA